MDEEGQVTGGAPEADTAEGDPADAAPAEAWHDVIAQLDALGEAMGRWARAAVNEPGNREKASEIKEHVAKLAGSVSDAVDDVGQSDVGESFKSAAAKTGEAFKMAGERVSEEVAPRVALAFRAAAEKLHQAAERMEVSPDSGAQPVDPETDDRPTEDS